MTDYEKLKQIYFDLEDISLDLDSITETEFVKFRTKAEIFLRKKFGAQSSILESFNKIITKYYSPKLYAFDNAFQDAKPVFEAYLEELEEEMEEKHINITSNNSINVFTDFSKVFIVHGHDGEMRESVARLIERQGIQVIILSDEINTGATIIEKIEKYSNVGAAICIFTSDDVGKSKRENIERDRARQNVVLETGYFIGKLGRDRVIILSNGDLEFPSDLQGIVYTGSEWKFKMLKELREMGYAVDLNKL